MDKIDEKAIGLALEIRDHPGLKSSPNIQLAIRELVDELTVALRKKSELSKKAHEGYIIWKGRSLNYAHIIGDLRRRKATQDSKLIIYMFAAIRNWVRCDVAVRVKFCG